MRKMKRGQWIAAVFGLALAGTLTFGVTYDAQAAERSLIAGEWINMEGGPGVAQWKNEDGTIVEQPGVMPGDAQNSNLENTNDAQSSQGSSADPSQTAAPGTTDNAQTDNGRQIDPDKPMVALTFDDGPYAPVGNRIMDCLAQYGGKATFYVVGERCASYQAELQRMVAEGHEIGNHTNNHKYLNKLDAAQIREQIQKGNQAITDFRQRSSHGPSAGWMQECHRNSQCGCTDRFVEYRYPGLEDQECPEEHRCSSWSCKRR